MPSPAVTTDVSEATDIRFHLMPQFSLDVILLFNLFSKAIRILFREIFRPYVRIDIEFCKNLLAERKSDPIEVRECRFDSFIVRKVHT
jgi:hypothetical protein